MLTEAVVLAGGLGTRLRAVVSDVPKPLAPVRGRPFLAYVLDHLAQSGVQKAVLSVGYKADTVRAAIGSRHGTMRIAYAEEATPLGTGGGIRLGLEQTDGDSVLALNGDTFFPSDLTALARLHKSGGADMTLALKHMTRCDRYGTLTLDRGNRITGFAEKGAVADGLINGGVYALRRALLEEWPLGQPFSIEKDVLEKQAPTRRFIGMPSDTYFIDIGIPEDYARAQSELP
jgi:D-glycero-alpha-D-manno-heptose 1-phosphate guanylyltransferase